MKQISRLLSPALLATALLAGCGQSAKAPAPAPTPPPAASAQAAWPDIANRFVEDYFKAQPFFAVQSGRHEFDGQMPDLSAAGIAHEVARLQAARKELAGVEPAGLTAAQKLERDVLLNVSDRDLFWLDQARWPFRNPSWYLDKLDPDVYLSRDYAPLEQRLKGFIGYSRAVPGIVAAIRANLQTPLPRTYVEYGIKAFGGMADFYQHDIPKIFASVKDPQLQKDLKAANAAAITAMQELTRWMSAQRKGATEGFAIGPDMYATMLEATERIDIPVAQIEAAGQADLERNTDMLRKACAQYLPGGSLPACMAKMSADKPRGGVVEAAREQLKTLKSFIEQHQVVSIPSQEEAKVALAPPYNSANFAYINIPGPYDHGVASIYNIAPPDPTWSKAVQQDYIPGKDTLLITSAHEVWPGHFLQGLHANANPSKILSLWWSYAYAEGWAHYCEEMMVDEGLGGGDPEVRIAQLKDALLRDVRLISSIGMHTHGMSVADSEKMFRERAFQDLGNARQQSARGTYDPGYLYYTLGKLMIKKLRTDWLAAQNPPHAGDDIQAWRAFHDKFLSYGAPAVPQVRHEMVGDQGSLL